MCVSLSLLSPLAVARSEPATHDCKEATGTSVVVKVLAPFFDCSFDGLGTGRTF